MQGFATPPPSTVLRALSASRSPTEGVQAHAVGEDRSGPGSVMARQRLIDNVKEALGNVASQTRAAGERAAKAVGRQGPKKGGATKAAAGTQSAAKRTSTKPPEPTRLGAEGNNRHAGARKTAAKTTTAKAAGRAKTLAQKATAATPGGPENRREDDGGQNAQPGENPGPEDLGQGCREEGSCQETQSGVTKATPYSTAAVSTTPAASAAAAALHRRHRCSMRSPGRWGPARPRVVDQPVSQHQLRRRSPAFCHKRIIPRPNLIGRETARQPPTFM